jgi:taurine--2-oxoglutarate transaminase
MEKVLDAMATEDVVALSRKHTLFEWSAQAKLDPVAVSHARGVYFWTPEGKRLLDFNSQLMCVNIGHGDDRIARAVADQMAACAYVAPLMTTEPRARLGAKLATLTPGDIDVFFFTNGGTEANENAIKIARAVTGRRKILARYRSYHGATGASITATGDPRRWAAEPGIPDVVHVLDPYHGVQDGWDSADRALALVEEVVQLEGPHTIAAFLLEPITGTNGVLVPPDGYIEGLRALCTKYGILMICDEVMSGFGRTGEWFAVDHWKVVPDLITMAKGLTSAYVPLGAVGMRRHIAEYFDDHVFWGGLTYSGHPVACAAALATIRVYEEDGLVDNARRMGVVMRTMLDELSRRHPSIGAARSIGLFGAVELIRNRDSMQPMAPFNGSSPEMAAFASFLRREGLYTVVRWNTFFVNPPLCITESELREGFAIIDRALDVTDRAFS